MDTKFAEKRRNSEEMDDLEDDFHQEQARSASPKNGQGQMDPEKRLRREIANSNERRRMQSINAGFQSLKSQIPHQDGEKLSKAAILHQASDHISCLEQEKAQLLIQNAHLRKRLKELAPAESENISPPPKRKKRDTESSDEGISMNFDENTEILELRNLLQRERQQRMFLEEKTRSLEAQLHPDRLCQIASHVSQHMVCSSEKMEVDKRMEPPPAVIAPATDKPLIPDTPGHIAPIAVSPPQDIPPKQVSPAPAAFTSPQSKRNLEIIAEAIRHLEGDNCLFDGKEPHGFRSHLGSEESQTESSNSDQEDSKSESSGRGSPPIVVASGRNFVPIGLERQTATLHVSAPQLIGTLPAATIQMLHPHMYGRPGFLIPMSKSS